MTDPRDIFSSLRAKQPPPGARERVLRRIEDRSQRKPRRLWIAFAAASVATAAWAWQGRKIEHARVENTKVSVARFEERAEPLPFAKAQANAPEPRPEVVVQVSPPLPPPAVHRERPRVNETPPIEVPAPIEIPAPIEAPSDLALQVEAYRAAQVETDDAAALERYREIKRRWPAGALDTEVDLRIVQTLVRLQKTDEARAAARAFAAAHPENPRAGEMKTFGEQ
jgi:hypothetical protein